MLSSFRSLRHPLPTYTLLFSHFLERFGFWGMRGLLVLYMIEPIADGGLGWAEKDGVVLKGILGGFLYLSAVIGGTVADRWWGGRATAITGAALMTGGIAVMAVNIPELFYLDPVWDNTGIKVVAVEKIIDGPQNVVTFSWE